MAGKNNMKMESIFCLAQEQPGHPAQRWELIGSDRELMGWHDPGHVNRVILHHSTVSVLPNSLEICDASTAHFLSCFWGWILIRIYMPDKRLISSLLLIWKWEMTHFLLKLRGFFCFWFEEIHVKMWLRAPVFSPLWCRINPKTKIWWLWNLRIFSSSSRSKLSTSWVICSVLVSPREWTDHLLALIMPTHLSFPRN